MSKRFLTSWWTGKHAPPPLTPSPVFAKIFSDFRAQKLQGNDFCSGKWDFPPQKSSHAHRTRRWARLEAREGFGPLELSCFLNRSKLQQPALLELSVLRLRRRLFASYLSLLIRVPHQPSIMIVCGFSILRASAFGTLMVSTPDSYLHLTSSGRTSPT